MPTSNSIWNDDKIRQRRLELGLSQEALGKAIGRDQLCIANLENGIVVDNLASALWQLASTLEVPLHELLWNTGETPRQKPKRQVSDADAKVEVKPPQVPIGRIEDVPAEERAAMALLTALHIYQDMPYSRIR